MIAARRQIVCRVGCGIWFGSCLVLATSLSVRAQVVAGSTTFQLLEIENHVEVLRAGAVTWDPAGASQILHPGDQIRTGERSRALLRLSNQTTLRVGQLSQLRVPPARRERAISLRLFRGLLYFFHRDEPGLFEVETPTVSAVVRGTEFAVQVAEDQRTWVTLLDGQLSLTNEWGTLGMRSAESATADRGVPPRKTAVINTVLAIQWSLYYPAIVDPDELGLADDERVALARVLAVYRAGDLQGALALWPAETEGEGASRKVMRSALLLSVGDVTEAERLLSEVLDDNLASGSAAWSVGFALRQLIEVVRRGSPKSVPDPQLASEWLAASYGLQAIGDLAGARDAALRAKRISPGFGFAWVRLAEMEFSHGRVRQATAALAEGIRLSPRNAQGWALKGFLLAARGRTREGVDAFEQAILSDGALANGWLGRGLCRIQLGDLAGGLGDLQVAATVEPQRSILRSYLARGFSEDGQLRLARQEVERAMELDPLDPTGWLYSALIAWQSLQVNRAIEDLEESQRRNDNRGLYRSRLLLDQDRAVRSANLALIYDEAGLPEFAFREAANAVAWDYANYSSHLFLANSYDSRRDPRMVSLRYESAALSEYLVANLLAPPAAGTLSRTISQHEYSRLFNVNRPGLTSRTEYRGNGDWFQDGAVMGAWRGFSASVEGTYRSENGQRPNNDLEHWQASAATRQGVTSQDTVFLQAAVSGSTGGDLRRVYDPAEGDRSLRFEEQAAPVLLAGYRREWTPENHTLALAGWVDAELSQSTAFQPILLLGSGPGGEVTLIAQPELPPAPLEYELNARVFTAEVQQIVKVSAHTLVGGARFQAGFLDVSSDLGPSASTQMGNTSGTLPFLFATPAWAQSAEEEFSRCTAYLYDYWQVLDVLCISPGIAFDYLRHPENFRSAPLVEGDQTAEQWSPKIGLLYTPTTRTAVRAGYSKSLGGVVFDQSFRLEPSQVAGFTQTHRSLMPESVAGSVSAESFDTWGLGIEQRFPTRTRVGVEAVWLESSVDQDVGTFDLSTSFPFEVRPSWTRSSLEFREQDLAVTLNQLAGDLWSFGARYRWSRARLGASFPEIPSTVSTLADTDLEAELQQVALIAAINHPSGPFARTEARWTQQQHDGNERELPTESFWHLDVHAGWRFRGRRAEIRVGVLNLTDQDYRLRPLNYLLEPPRERTFVTSLRLSF
jgi:tetratricopeptide (TPR) repeat protein